MATIAGGSILCYTGRTLADIGPAAFQIRVAVGPAYLTFLSDMIFVFDPFEARS